MTAHEPVTAVMESGQPDGWATLLGPGKTGPLLVLAGGVLMQALSLRVVATVMPSAVAEIGGVRFFAWASTVAFVGAIWGAALASPLAAARGLRAGYWVSLLVFAGGSALCATAPEITRFLGGRLLQGLGGGLLTALAYTTIRRVFPAAVHTRAITIVSGVWSVGALCGPLFGGLFAGWGSWRSAFWIDLPLALTIGALAEQIKVTRGRSRLERSTDGGKIGLDRLALLGGAAIAVSVGGVSGRSFAGAFGLIVGLALLVATMRIDNASVRRPGSARLLPAGAFDPRSTLGAVSLAMALMAGCTTASFYVPYVFAEAGGHDPIAGGYLSTIVAVSWTAAAFASAGASRKRAQALIVCAPILEAAGLIFCAWMLDTGSFALVAAALVPVGAGVGFAWAHLGSLLIASAREAERDLAGAFISTLQLIAQAFASALAGMVANLAGFADPASAADGVERAVFWVFLVFSLLAAAAVPAGVRALRDPPRS